MSGEARTERWLEELSPAECLGLLRANEIGRIAIIYNGRPFVFPVNYKLIESAGDPALVIRTRPGNTIDLAENTVAFEVDGIDPAHRRGWSVLIQGALRLFDDGSAPLEWPQSWIEEEGRSRTLAIVPTLITGRRLKAAALEWAFHQSAYL